ncbi:uncharacterized protein LOC135371788 [Ornithodoros turicata]|uniref:uncharacterized protein LOC135371788 n=1 Tax=Ornithodoros turicata TaxID=34597 RepID=UPI0031391756
MSKEVTRICEELKREIKQDIKLAREGMERELRNELRELKNSMDFFNKNFEEFRSKMEALSVENSNLRSANEALQRECHGMKTQLRDLNLKSIQLEQYSRNRNIEIKGIPFIQGECIPGILKKLGEAVGEPICESDIDVCHRVPVVKGPTQNIVVQFCRRGKRDTVLERSKKKRLTSLDLGFTDSQPLYVNEHLCPDLKKLLGMTVAAKKEMKWKFAWVKHGKIFARQDESSPIVSILSPDDLSKMK